MKTRTVSQSLRPKDLWADSSPFLANSGYVHSSRQLCRDDAKPRGSLRCTNGEWRTTEADSHLTCLAGHGKQHAAKRN